MNTDVLILGGGLAGIAAAYEIIQNSDLQVTLLQCGGGASPKIHGFCLPVGPDDSEELFFEDTMVSGCRQNREALVRRLCRDSLCLPAWFESLGLEPDGGKTAPQLIKSLGSTAARIAGIGNDTGPVMLRTLRKHLNACPRYRECTHLRALELLKKDGAVVGARCYDKKADGFVSVGAGTVILATGGFGKLFPESTNSPDIGGDGCAMAYLAGGSLTDMEFIQFEPSAAVWPEALIGRSIITTMFYEGAVLRNRSGERFMLRHGSAGEQEGKDVLAKAIAEEIREGRGTEHGGVLFDATAVPSAMWEGVYKPYLDRYLAHGIDLREQPVEIAPAAHTTCGGVLIDENCRTGVEGLLACGEVTGGLHGANRLGGNAGLETMVFGRIAGKSAVEDGRKNSSALEEAFVQNLPADETALRKELGEILRTCLGVIRTEDGLVRGIAGLDALTKAIGSYENCYEKHRLHNDVLTARLALACALERKGSIGCHNRGDSQAESEKYRLIVTKGAALLRQSV